jgi:hypothetical protein
MRELVRTSRWRGFGWLAYLGGRCGSARALGSGNQIGAAAVRKAPGLSRVKTAEVRLTLFGIPGMIRTGVARFRRSGKVVYQIVGVRQL